MPHALVLLLVIVAVVCVLGAIARKRTAATSGGEADSFSRFVAAPALLTANEAEFFAVAAAQLEPRYRVFAKVRLADLVEITGSGSKLGPLGRVSQKHVDFVVCEPSTFRVVGVVEVDDASHQRADRAASDRTKDEVLARVGIPLVRVVARSRYQRSEVELAFARFLAPVVDGAVAAADSAGRTVRARQTAAAGGAPAVGSAAGPGAAPVSPAPSATACPRCGRALVERTSNAGNRFVGCAGFPACRYTAPAAG